MQLHAMFMFGNNTGLIALISNRYSAFTNFNSGVKTITFNRPVLALVKNIAFSARLRALGSIPGPVKLT